MRNTVQANEKKYKFFDLEDFNLAKFMFTEMKDYAVEHHDGLKLTVKYLDPKVAIRSARPNAEDADMCQRIAIQSVHSAMTGYTDHAIGVVRNTIAMIPVDVMVATGPRNIRRRDPDWQRLIASTG